MATNDVILYGGELTPENVRLGGPSGVTIASSVTAATESYSAGTLVESFLAAFGARTETFASLAAIETFIASIGSFTETKAGVALAEAFLVAVTAATETYSASVLVETFSAAIQAVTETYVALADAESESLAITAGTETGASAAGDVVNPFVEPRPTAAGGGMGSRKRRKWEMPEDADPSAPFRRAPVPVGSFDEPEPWSLEKDQESEDDELMSVFALMIDEDLF